MRIGRRNHFRHRGGDIYLFIYVVDNLVEVEHGSLALCESSPSEVIVDRVGMSLLSVLAGQCNHLHPLPHAPVSNLISYRAQISVDYPYLYQIIDWDVAMKIARI